VRAFEVFFAEMKALLLRPDVSVEEVGHHAARPRLLQRDPELSAADVVAEYQRALSAGDVDAVPATFEPDGYAREPAGGYVHRGRDGLRAFYEHLFSNDGGIPLEHCALVDDGRACALEYNVVRWGKVPFRVLLDGESPGPSDGVDVDEDGNGVLRDGRMYQLIRQHGAVRERTLEITFLEPGAEAYAFTFG
jgi:hypothetical protein